MHRSKRTRYIVYPLLSFFLLVAPSLRAQNTPDPSQPPEGKTERVTPPGSQSAAARVRARRQERIQAITRDIYGHQYDAYAGGGYLRFRPGNSLQRATEEAWNAGITDYIRPHLGITVDARGYYGIAYTYNNQFQVFKPSISQYAVMAGPQYRVEEKQHYAVALRVLAGLAHGNLDTNTGGLPGNLIGLYPNGNVLAINGGIPVDINISPALGVRLTPELQYTRFGSANQTSLGFSAGVLYRFGKR